MTTKTVDATGLFCPGPVQVLKGVIKRVGSGDSVELLADDSDSKIDVQEFCDEEGHSLESVTENDGVITFKVVKK